MKTYKTLCSYFTHLQERFMREQAVVGACCDGDGVALALLIQEINVCCEGDGFYRLEEHDHGQALFGEADQVALCVLVCAK